MEIFTENNRIFIKGRNSFDISETLECGQCFRFEPSGDRRYIIIAKGKVLNISQNDQGAELYPCPPEEAPIWLDYFDLHRNYDEIKEILREKDPVLCQAIDFAGGIRILNQDFEECLFSFIISQNNRIPMIKKVIKNLSEGYGSPIGDNFYSFPDHKILSSLTIEELMAQKTGFRAKYILDAAARLSGEGFNLEELSALNTESLRKRLMEIRGVGEKVADCVMLFSLGRREVFPTDVWVKRVMQHYYFGGKEVSIKEIHSMAMDKWGDLAGFAQQYLFHFARSRKIGGRGSLC